MNPSLTEILGALLLHSPIKSWTTCIMVVHLLTACNRGSPKCRAPSVDFPVSVTHHVLQCAGNWNFWYLSLYQLLPDAYSSSLQDGFPLLRCACSVHPRHAGNNVTLFLNKYLNYLGKNTCCNHRAGGLIKDTRQTDTVYFAFQFLQRNKIEFVQNCGRQE